MTKKMIYYLCSVLALGLIVFVSSKTAPKQKNVPEINQTETKEENKNTEQQPEQVDTTASSEAKDIFATIESENLWAVDVKNPQVLMMDETASTVKLRVVSIGAAFFPEPPSGANFKYDQPAIPMQVETIALLNGKEVPHEFTLLNAGGEVTLSDYEKQLDPGTIEKTGIDKLTKQEKDTKYILFTSEEDYTFETGKEYVVIVNYSNESENYSVGAGGYGVFIEKPVDEKMGKSTPEYENVLTQKDLGLEQAN